MNQDNQNPARPPQEQLPQPTQIEILMQERHAELQHFVGRAAQLQEELSKAQTIIQKIHGQLDLLQMLQKRGATLVPSEPASPQEPPAPPAQ